MYIPIKNINNSTDLSRTRFVCMQDISLIMVMELNNLKMVNDIRFDCLNYKII